MATLVPDDDALSDDKPPKTRHNTYELVEGRTNYRMWVPRYINGAFAARIGDGGIAVYSSLAWWLTSDAPHHRPTLTEIGQHAGCSRATVWRVLKVLLRYQLIELLPAIEATGRRAHRIRLIHPPEVIERDRELGTEIAGGSNLSAPRAQDERAARSNCARGALNPSAPSGLNQDLTVCEPKTDTHTPDPPSPKSAEHQAAANEFAAKWAAALVTGAPAYRIAVVQEARQVAELLLGRGWTLPELLERLADPQRWPNEWPRVFAERLGPTPTRAAPEPSREARTLQQRSQAAATAAAAATADEWTLAMQRLRDKIHCKREEPERRLRGTSDQ
jgi:hypothetical protein